MRFAINRRALKRGINVIQKNIVKTSINPILTNVLLELQKDGLFLTTNNGQVTIKHLIPYEKGGEIIINNAEEGAILIKSDLLVDLVNKLDNSETINFEVFDDTVIKIESNSFNATINGTTANEYPEIDLDESGTVLEMNARRFIEVVDQTSFAVSTKDKPPLNAIHFVAENGTLEVTATDTAKLARKTVAIKASESMTFNIIGKTADIIARMCEEEEAIKICVNKTRALFILDNTRISTQLVAVDYPNTKNIKMNNAQYRLEVNTQQIITALERVSSLSTTFDKAVRLVMNESGVKVSSRDEGLGNANENLSTYYYDSAPLEISCNYNNIVSALRALRCEEVVLEFTGEMRPFKVSNPRDDSILIMITPIRHI